MIAIVGLVASVLIWFLGTIAAFMVGGWLMGVGGTVLLSWLFWRELAMLTALVVMVVVFGLKAPAV